MTLYYENKAGKILLGNIIPTLQQMLPESVQCVVTSPPYFALRKNPDECNVVWGGDAGCEHVWGDEIQRESEGRRKNPDKYGKQSQLSSENMSHKSGCFCQLCGAWRGQLGLEPTPELFIQHLVEVFREVRRVLRKDGVCWLNLGDSYAMTSIRGGKEPIINFTRKNNSQETIRAWEEGIDKSFNSVKASGLKPKDLCMIPARVALALQADGWWVRQDIVWCLSGGTKVYARTQKGDMPMTLKDLYRLSPETVKLWNGERWTQLKGMTKIKRTRTALEIVLRSGERISCTHNHKFPTQRGIIEAGFLKIGDVLQKTNLPEPDNIKSPKHIDNDIAWFIGLYLAEGSISNSAIQISGHSKERDRWERLKKIAESYGGSVTRTLGGNKMDIRVYGRILHSFIKEFISGRVAKDKGFAPVIWRYSNDFIYNIMMGYLGGDGHWDKKNNRWRLGFTRNYKLEQDLRTACARLGWRIVLKPKIAKCGEKRHPAFRGEIRMNETNHYNTKNISEIIEIRNSRCRYVYDLGVEDESHVFALSSGILTHNSKPNPMPESVTDRCTKAHEYVFMLTRSARYFFDNEAIKEKAKVGYKDTSFLPTSKKDKEQLKEEIRTAATGASANNRTGKVSYTRNKRSVWKIAVNRFKGAHFATFPPALVEPMILSSTSEKGCCAKRGAPWARVVESSGGTIGRSWHDHKNDKVVGQRAENAAKGGHGYKRETTGWLPTCNCNADTIPCTVIDPFGGSGTTGAKAQEHNRRWILIDAAPEYCAMAAKRIDKVTDFFTGVCKIT